MNFRTLKAPAVAAALLILAASGCTDVTVAPKSTISDANIFSDPNSYEYFLAKVYAGLSATGQQGPAGNPDLAGFDEGFSQYLRLYFELQELPTEEAMIAWGGDGDLMDLNRFAWSSSNGYSSIFYSRVFYLVSLANAFLYQTTDDKLSARGNVDAALRAKILTFRAEARFLRAFAYWNALDLYGNVPVITAVSSTVPPQQSRDSVYNFVVSELNAIKDSLPAPGAANYGRATTMAAHMLLAEVYLNAEVYTGTAHYADALSEAQIVIGGGYSLASSYYNNFLADNNTSPEMIFPITEDGIHSRNYGATTFIVHASCGNNYSADSAGIPGGGNCWWGLRIKPQADSFYLATADHPAGDARSLALFDSGQALAISTPTDFTQGTLLAKFRNKTSTGAAGSDNYFVDVDFPVFRLAEAYLIYAEAVLRGGGGSAATALGYINLIRGRAYGGTGGDITALQLTLDFILAERGRELIWEAHRRTDLIRFGKFAGPTTYVWEWKGGTEPGAAVDAHYNLMPIPSSELAANPKMVQNTGY